MPIEFFQTGYGRRFFESQLPDLIETVGNLALSCEKLAKELKRYNDGWSVSWQKNESKDDPYYPNDLEDTEGK